MTQQHVTHTGQRTCDVCGETEGDLRTWLARNIPATPHGLTRESLMPVLHPQCVGAWLLSDGTDWRIEYTGTYASLRADLQHRKGCAREGGYACSCDRQFTPAGIPLAR